jgi:hypothetical protein
VTELADYLADSLINARSRTIASPPIVAVA